MHIYVHNNFTSHAYARDMCVRVRVRMHVRVRACCARMRVHAHVRAHAHDTMPF